MADLKNEYTQHIHDTAPDMDKLWDRIESEIDKKENHKEIENETTHQENREKIKSNMSYTKIAAIAAAFIVVFAGANIFNESRKAKIARENFPTERNSLSENNAFGEDIAEETDGAFNEPEKLGKGDENAVSKGDIVSVNYEQLDLNATDTQPYNISYIPTGNEFFVEKDVLSETQLFIDATVEEAKLLDDKAEYILKVNNMYTKDGTVDFGEIKVVSSTPYILQKNREYLLPLEMNSDGNYGIVFENAPQIELTLDGGMVFQNGWDSLENGSVTLEKKSLNMNDYYFDRMRYSPQYDISQLISEWKKA